MAVCGFLCIRKRVMADIPLGDLLSVSLEELWGLCLRATVHLSRGALMWAHIQGEVEGDQTQSSWF